MEISSILWVLLLLSTGITIGGIVFLAIRRHRKAKRLSSLLDKYEGEASLAIQNFLVMRNPDRFLPDSEKSDFKKKYYDLYCKVSSIKIPGQSDRLSVINEFIKCFQSIDSVQIDNNIAFFTKRTKGLEQAYSAISTTDRFVGYHEVQEFQTRWGEYLTLFKTLRNKKSYSKIPGYIELNSAAELLINNDGLQLQRNNNNKEYKQNELKECSSFFDSLFTYSLDEQQRNAIVCMEDNTLVVSSAGSGKTSTIVGRARYLVTKKHVSPEDILVVTYTRKAAEELQERMGIPGIPCSTIHKHAMDTIATLTGKRPTIVDPGALYNIFDNLLNKDKSFLKAVNKYVTESVNLIKDDHEYPSAQAKSADLQKYGLRSPYKDMYGNYMFLKSKQEHQITIILTNLGVNFSYEEKYPYDTATTNNRQYKPDFTIHYTSPMIDENGRTFNQERVLYYEHYGIDKNGEVPKWFGDGKIGGWKEAQEKYIRGIEWKRMIHEQNHTELMVTTSADFEQQSDMFSYIESLLLQHGVPINPLTEEQKRIKIQEANPNLDKTLFRLISGFITLLKANEKDIDIIENAIDPKGSNGDRNRFVLKDIVEPIYMRYQTMLKTEGVYDYTDILHQAANLCQNNNPYAYKHILVDEFQDISMDKFNYLRSLRKKKPYTLLFCVGDDWQSIYRFSGSDMTLFYDFKRYFGYTEECKIETTHRFGQPLLDKSSSFILKNPEQKKKIVRTTADAETGLFFIPYKSQNKRIDVEQIIERIPPEETVYILGRYSFIANSLGIQASTKDHDKSDITCSISGRKVRYLTVHSAKGLEADHIILLDCDSGTYGFPSQIADDPILEYVLSGADSYDNAEERRVFYVAITRARKATYCLYDENNPSPFVNEFGALSKTDDSTEVICPRCGHGFVRVIKDSRTTRGNPYITVRCTNKYCDYFENLFDGDANKYLPREPIQTWSLSQFNQTYPNTHHSLYSDDGIYLLINKNNSPEECLPIIVSPSLRNDSQLWERIKMNPDDLRVLKIEYCAMVLYFLIENGSRLFISDDDINDAIGHSDIIIQKIGYIQADL